MASCLWVHMCLVSNTADARGCAQTTNAMRRLKATFIDQVDAHEGVGGGANSVDLVRLDTGRTLGSRVSGGYSSGFHKQERTVNASFQAVNSAVCI